MGSTTRRHNVDTEDMDFRSHVWDEVISSVGSTLSRDAEGAGVVARSEKICTRSSLGRELMVTIIWIVYDATWSKYIVLE